MSIYARSALRQVGVGAAGPAHQGPHGIHGRPAFVQDGVHFAGDGHLDAVAGRQPNRRPRAPNTLRNLAIERLKDLGQRFATSEFDAHAAIS